MVFVRKVGRVESFNDERDSTLLTLSEGTADAFARALPRRNRRVVLADSARVPSDSVAVLRIYLPESQLDGRRGSANALRFAACGKGRDSVVYGCGRDEVSVFVSVRTNVIDDTSYNWLIFRRDHARGDWVFVTGYNNHVFHWYGPGISAP